MNLESEGSPAEPWWLQDLLKIRNLGFPGVHWEYREEQLHYVKRTVKAARLMQRIVLKDDHSIPQDTGSRLCLRHGDSLVYECTQLQRLYLDIEYEANDECLPCPVSQAGYDVPLAWAHLFGKIRGLRWLRINVNSYPSQSGVEDPKSHNLYHVM